MKSEAVCVKSSPMQVQPGATKLDIVDAMHARQDMIAILAAELIAGQNGDIDHPPHVASALAWTIELLADETHALVSAIHES